MTMHTGENEQGLKKVIDMTRMIAIAVLLIHCYYYCYVAFEAWQLTSKISDQVLKDISHTGLLNGFMKSKLIALAFLLLSVLGVKGRKSEKLNYRTAFAYLITGLFLYLTSGFILYINSLSATALAAAYISITGTGFILILTGGGLLTRIIKRKLKSDVFNKGNETFPQEERLVTNAYSLNLPARYKLKSQTRNSWINFVNARRGILIMGSPGSGKSYFVVENFIRQIIERGMALFVFDHKFPELSTLTYNCFLKHRNKYPRGTAYYSINFTKPELSHQCNPIHPATLLNLTSAIESSRSLLLSMNRTWVNKQGDFFIESPINLLAAVIWFLRKYRDGMYCTLPHAIELLHVEYEKLFTVLNTETEISTLINPFIQLYKDDDMETLGNQVVSVKIPLGRISSPEFYYILSGDDFSLDINNPKAPKIFCLGNDPQSQEALAPLMSLYVDRLNKIINQPGRYPCAQVCDEFASIRATSVMKTIATGRSNNIITVIAVQDYSQLKLMYSKEEAEVIFNITGNIISGQVSGETAKLLSDRFAKTFQERESISVNSGDTSISRSKQLEVAVPASTISSLSSGEFVGLVADNPDELIELKTFHAMVVNDHAAISKENQNYLPLSIIRKIDQKEINTIQQIIKQDVQDIVDAVMEEVLNDPGKAGLVVKERKN
ncbi:conjugal transfer protein MobC [Parafilimonas sp.]|uniref:conjugal transfer protein MobC n=1 Tax=Parafilimonas sp. TaxID=1969739 RepID=UPI003F7E1A7D